jgi:hypothetical protein
MKIFAFGFAAGCAALLAGCATTTSPQVWDSRQTHYTETQAVKELGVPEKTVSLSDGSSVDVWLYRPGTRDWQTTYAYIQPVTFTVTEMQEYNILRTRPYIPQIYLRLLFAPDGTLESWDRIAL